MAKKTPDTDDPGDRCGGPVHIFAAGSSRCQCGRRECDGMTLTNSRSWCIHCHRYLEALACRCYYGAHEIGPFCERCDAVIKAHTRFHDKEIPAPVLQPGLRESIALTALKAARGFILNGVELGYILMPTMEIDPAHQVLPLIQSAIKLLAAPDPRGRQEPSV